VWAGAKLTNREALGARERGVTAVLDLTAEFAEVPAFLELPYCNIPILDLTGLGLEQLRTAASFIERHAPDGIVYVHCKVGYSRTAAIVGAYLLATGQASTVEHAVALLGKARPGIIIRPEALAALHDFEQVLAHHETVERLLGPSI
jgi:protein-tyrosine phosphatase